MDKKAQSTMEFVILSMIIVSALFAMQVYLKRGIQGRLRTNIDSIGSAYDPAATESNFTIIHNSHSTTTTVGTPVTRSAGTAHWTVLRMESNTETSDNSNRFGREVVGPF